MPTAWAPDRQTIGEQRGQRGDRWGQPAATARGEQQTGATSGVRPDADGCGPPQHGTQSGEPAAVLWTTTHSTGICREPARGSFSTVTWRTVPASPGRAARLVTPRLRRASAVDGTRGCAGHHSERAEPAGLAQAPPSQMVNRQRSGRAFPASVAPFSRTIGRTGGRSPPILDQHAPSRTRLDAMRRAPRARSQRPLADGGNPSCPRGD